jgi:hypothetical protein
LPEGDTVKKKVEKPAPEAEQARQIVKTRTSRKTYHSLDTEYGVLTVEDAPEEPAARRPRQNRKPRP